MAKKKATPLAQALTLVDSLSADDIATLSDYLRGKLPATPRKASTKKVKATPATQGEPRARPWNSDAEKAAGASGD